MPTVCRTELDDDKVGRMMTTPHTRKRGVGIILDLGGNPILYIEPGSVLEAICNITYFRMDGAPSACRCASGTGGQIPSNVKSNF